MNFFETVLGWLLGAVTFFDNLKARRRDDPAMARFRSLKRACFWSTALSFGVLGLGYLLANVLDVFGHAVHSPRAFDDARGTIANVFLGLLVLSTLFAAYNYWRLWRFERGDDEFA